MSPRRLNHEGSLSQLPSGSWRAQITLNGKRIGKTFPRQRAARDWLHQMYQLKQDGHTYDAHTTTLSTLLTAWLNTRAPSLRPNTLDQYTRTIRLYITPTLGHLKLADLTPALLQTTYDAHLAKLQRAGHTSRPLHIAHTILHQVLDHATRLGLLTRNPADSILIPQIAQITPEATTLHVWTETQVTHFLASLPSFLPLPHYSDNGGGREGVVGTARNTHLYHLALATGARRGEILGLQWTDIDWLHSTLTIARQVTELPDGGWTYQTPKTRAGRRTIQIGPGVLAALRAQQHLVDLLRQLAGDRWQENNLIFPNTLGKPQNGYNLSKEFHQLSLAAHLPPIRFHDLRHTAASLMLSHGIPLIEVSHTLGHSLPSITLDIYAHYIPQDQTASAALMDQLTTLDLLPLPNHANHSIK